MARLVVRLKLWAHVRSVVTALLRTGVETRSAPPSAFTPEVSVRSSNKHPRMCTRDWTTSKPPPAA
eukprot:835221-Prymnesium_polylepis.2